MTLHKFTTPPPEPATTLAAPLAAPATPPAPRVNPPGLQLPQDHTGTQDFEREGVAVPHIALVHEHDKRNPWPSGPDRYKWATDWSIALDVHPSDAAVAHHVVTYSFPNARVCRATQESIAASARHTRGTVCRALLFWERRGLILAKTAGRKEHGDRYGYLPLVQLPATPENVEAIKRYGAAAMFFAEEGPDGAWRLPLDTIEAADRNRAERENGRTDRNRAQRENGAQPKSRSAQPKSRSAQPKSRSARTSGVGVGRRRRDKDTLSSSEEVVKKECRAAKNGSPENPAVDRPAIAQCEDLFRRQEAQGLAKWTGGGGAASKHWRAVPADFASDLATVEAAERKQRQPRTPRRVPTRCETCGNANCPGDDRCRARALNSREGAL